MQFTSINNSSSETSQNNHGYESNSGQNGYDNNVGNSGYGNFGTNQIQIGFSNNQKYGSSQGNHGFGGIGEATSGFGFNIGNQVYRNNGGNHFGFNVGNQGYRNNGRNQGFGKNQRYSNRGDNNFYGSNRGLGGYNSFGAFGNIGGSINSRQGYGHDGASSSGFGPIRGSPNFINISNNFGINNNKGFSVAVSRFENGGYNGRGGDQTPRYASSGLNGPSNKPSGVSSISVQSHVNVYAPKIPGRYDDSGANE